MILFHLFLTSLPLVLDRQLKFLKNLIIALLTTIKRYWRFITLLVLTAISIFSLTPLAVLPPTPGTDKTHHFIAYATLMLPTALRKPKHLPLISLFFIAWSGAIELIQPYVNRYGELQDLAANAGGLICGWLIAKALRRFFLLDSNK